MLLCGLELQCQLRGNEPAIRPGYIARAKGVEFDIIDRIA
jgi:hypothetical protein